MKKTLQKSKKRFLNLVFQFLACAMVCNLWRIHWVAKLNLLTTVSLVKHLLKWTLHLHCSKAWTKTKLFGCPTLTMQQKFLKGSKSLRIQKTALLHLCKIKNANYTLCNIMQKYCILNMVKKCFTTSCMKYVVSQAHGQWQTMQKLLLMKSVTLQAMVKYCQHCPAVQIAPLQQLLFLKLLATN